jgi:3-oxoacyl-[acyl-carrier-protein] synthase II
MDAETRTVVVTGVGCVSPVGVGCETSWSNLLDARGGVHAIDRFDASDFPVRIAAAVEGFEPTNYLDRKEARKTDRYIQMAVAATLEALEQAGLEINAGNAERVGVFISSAMGGLETFETGIRTLIERGPNRISPFFIPMTLVDMAGGYVAIQIGAKGPNLAAVSACASGGHAIGEAFETIRRGAADVMLAGASEAPITPSGVGGFAAAGALSSRNDDPEHASRPFDLDRDGFVLGEGAAVLVLESLEHADARGATVLATLSGYATTADAHHITQPADGGEGAARAMRIALAQAGLMTGEISYINAHGTSTRLNDKFETMALKSVFNSTLPPVSSTKGATGHLLGAAPAVEAAFSVLALRDQIMPPTINYRTPDPDCDLDCVPNEARPAELEHVMSNSFGFGGHNVVLVFSRG